jgi:SWI/SNF-related matrix-associated actin-dependent regulator 1 of chromatin subfamily A
MKMIPNKYDGSCIACRVKIGIGQGFAYHDGYRWRQVCKSAACHKQIGLDKEQEAPKNRLTESGEIIMGYDPNAIPLLRSMPGARWNPDKKRWTVSIKPSDLGRVIEVCEKLKISVPDSLRKASDEGTADSQEADQRSERLRSDGKGLFPFQKIGVKWISLHDRALISDEQGLGKTLESLLSLPSNQRVIVVCPASVKYNWRNEANLWRPDYKVLVVKTKNDFVLPEEGQIVIINYDILPDWLSPKKEKNEDGTESKRKTYHIPEEYKVILSQLTVIADEIHFCKNHQASRSAKFVGLQKHSKRCWGLTGTPLMNRPFDLWGVLSAIGCTKQFASFPKFIELFNGSVNEWGGYEFGLPTVECSERMKRVMLRRLKTEVLKELPAKTYQTIMIDELSAKDKKVLDLCAKELTEDDEEGTIEEKISRIDLDSLPSFESFSKIRAMIAASRIPAMLEIVEEYEESETPLVVFSAHRAPIDELAKREGWAVITGDVKPEERTEIVGKFQDGELKGVGLTISAGGVGLTLTRASHVLFVDKDWTPGNNMQAEDRLHRIGQVNSVLVKTMVSNHPLDIHVHNLIEYKMEMARRALDASYSYEAKDAIGTMSRPIDLIEETQGQRDERIRRATTDAEKAIARDKIKAITDRESSRVAHVEEPKLTEEKKQLLIEALGYMNSVCDGAKKKDDMGFNKADTGIARWFGMAMLTSEDDDLYRTLERILVRYKGQLSSFGIWD